MSAHVSRLRPRNADEMAALLRQAGADGTRLSVTGGGSKRELYAAEVPGGVLDVAGLSGVTQYQPEELVLSLRAGTPLDYLNDVLAERGQMLAFEPPDYSKVLGTQPTRSTIGGVLGCGYGGPRRLSTGNVRDHILGFEAVSGAGERFRAGGRVIKNVTGYDLAKLMVGSWGTLAVLTEVSLRVLPRPEAEATLMVERSDLHDALADVRAALATPLEISGAAHLADGRSALRLEGFQRSVDERLRGLRARFDGKGRMRAIEQAESATLWRSIRDLDAFAADDRPLWRLSLPASRAAQVVSDIARQEVCEAQFDWGGSLVWLAVASVRSAGFIRDCCAQAQGHAWLFRAPAGRRSTIGTAPPQPAALAALSRRVKQGFDPHNVLGDGPFLLPTR